MKKLEILNNTKRTGVSDSLFSEIQEKLTPRDIISLRFVRVAAAVFLCVISVKIFATSHMISSKTASDEQNVIPVTNTFLNYE